MQSDQKNNARFLVALMESGAWHYWLLRALILMLWLSLVMFAVDSTY